jgi:two-component system chemotaxis response regulator CheB
MAMKKIKVLIVDDSKFMREFIASAISKDSGIEVVGKASDPYDARDKILEFNPDVMTLDVEMPKMNGIEFLRKLMPQYPLPVLVVSSVSDSVFDALDAGAVDFVNKSNISSETGKQSFISELIVKIKIASIAKVGQFKHSPLRADAEKKPLKKGKEDFIIAIGASTGGTEATYAILKDLGSDLPGIVVVQHMPPVFTRLYAERLNNSCRMEVKEAVDGDAVLPGRVLIAPGDFQMQVQKKDGRYKVKVAKGEKVSGHCPSVDVLFDSVAKAAGNNAMGVILTGMGSDGANGLLAMRNKGAETVGQNMETCVVYGMPMVAKNIGAVARELPLNEIYKKIYQWYNEKLPG